MQLHLLNVITTYDDRQAGEILAKMQDYLIEADIELFDEPFEGVIAQVNYSQIVEWHKNGGYWREIKSFELGLYTENLAYNLQDLSPKIPDQLFVYIEVWRNEQTLFYEGFSLRGGEIIFNQKTRTPEGLEPLIRQVAPHFRGESFYPFSDEFTKKILDRSQL